MNRHWSLRLSLAASLLSRIPFACLRTTFSLLLVLNLGSTLAWAGLGQPEASVTTDQQHMKSEDNVQTFQAYKVHQLTSANGPTVREYVSPQGVVFGITWQGRFAPDIHQLLGTYVTNLETATSAQTQIHHLRSLTVKTGAFVYSNFCHMQMCKGTAYVPSLIPSNASAEVIR